MKVARVDAFSAGYAGRPDVLRWAGDVNLVPGVTWRRFFRGGFDFHNGGRARGKLKIAEDY
jgi:hypothetical protein